MRRDDSGLYIETWSGNGWTDGPYTLGRYVYDGEPGAEQITVAQGRKPGPSE